MSSETVVERKRLRAVVGDHMETLESKKNKTLLNMKLGGREGL